MPKEVFEDIFDILYDEEEVSVDSKEVEFSSLVSEKKPLYVVTSFWTYYRFYQYVYEPSKTLSEDNFFRQLESSIIIQYEDIPREEIFIFFDDDLYSEYLNARKYNYNHQNCLHKVELKIEKDESKRIEYEHQRLSRIPKN